jgi:ectoine hydroxylase-related dioxygenase (phytanoyl-CoA dioxygenase family)
METIEKAGFAFCDDILNDRQIHELLSSLRLDEHSGTRTRRGSVYAARNLLQLPEIRQLVQTPEMQGLVEPFLGKNAFAVRGILFDKNSDANWKVVWHQDISIAVKEKIETAGFAPWSQKADVPHVQPPAEILERMLTVRLHLDDCHADNGPLKVLSGSHRHGKLDAPEIARWRQRVAETICEVPRGGALLMKPLLLHASAPAVTPGHRRVIHLDFAAQELPNGLQWYDQCFLYLSGD